MPVVVQRSETAFGRTLRATRAVDPRLRGVLARPYVGIELQDATFAAWLEPPRPVVKLIVDLDGALALDGAALPDAWLGGLDDRPARVGFGGDYAALDVELTPLAAYAVLGMPLGELRGTQISLGALFGAHGEELAARLRETADWDARFDALDAFLLRRLDAGVRPSPDTAWAWRLLAERAGRVRVGELATELGCSRRHLAQRFAEQVGLPPKTVARLRRFEHLRAALGRAGAAAWADVALECGYADQAHLTREVRALAGVTPTELVARLMPGGGVDGS